MRKILLFGGSGSLGSQLLSDRADIIAPTSAECDITASEDVMSAIARHLPEVVIHSAAIVGMRECEENKEAAWNVNVQGTHNIVNACRRHDVRLVFISTNTVFDGTKEGGLYKEGDIPNPQFYYAFTKLCAEQAVRQLKASAIIRTDFFTPGKLKYSQVFDDHFTSKISVDILSERVLQIAESAFTGIMHIGGDRQKLIDIMRQHIPDVSGISIEASAMPDYPRDLSLSCEKWRQIFGE